MRLTIARGASRTDKAWKNQEINWPELAEMLAVPLVTKETAADYARMSRDAKGAVKDVGGFVGGALYGGRRVQGAVLSRSVLTLDLDHMPAGEPSPQFLDFMRRTAPFAWVLHSTHSHTPAAPRLRIIAPLDRACTVDEYEALARKFAHQVGIDLFDDTTYQPSRLMYWPSVPCDVAYFFAKNDGEPMPVDTWLGMYAAWGDVTQWPFSSRMTEIIRQNAAKQGDPLEKPGLVGAFCREYDIHEAIEAFVADRYVATDDPNRYTYAGGSSSKGAVVYEDKFLYSHHESDPCSGRLVNAFDLVRSHRFGVLDSATRDTTHVTKLPSYDAMLGLIQKDARTQKRLAEERAEAAFGAFGHLLGSSPDDPQAPTPVDVDWQADLDTDKKGNVRPTRDNVIKILEGDPLLKGAFARDIFSSRDVLRRPVPWCNTSDAMRDKDDSGLRWYIEKAYGIVAQSVIKDAFEIVLSRNEYHPVREYLAGLVWDGRPRLDTLLIDYFGADDTTYTRAAMRKWACAAVQRVLHPGVKFDSMLILASREGGVYKSSFFAKLGGAWFSDSLTEFKSTRDVYEQVQGSWIMEVPELSSMRRSEKEAVKHFLSKRSDRYRPFYGHRIEDHARQCVLAGTSNEDEFEFLRDSSGARRFWPVRAMPKRATRNVWRDLTEAEVGQVWAEAYALAPTEALYFENETAKVGIHEAHADFTPLDPNIGLLGEFLDTPLPENWYELAPESRVLFSGAKNTLRRDFVSVIEIWYEHLKKPLGVPVSRQDSYTIGEWLRSMPGWASGGTRRVPGYGAQKVFVRVGA